MTLQELQELYGLTLKGDLIYILIKKPPESVFCPIMDDEIEDCVLVTKDEFEDLISENDDPDHQEKLLTLWKDTK